MILAEFLSDHKKHGSGRSLWIVLEAITKLDRKLTKIMSIQSDLTADLKLVLAQQQKTSAEIATVQASVNVQAQRIAELEAIIAAGGPITQELIDAVAAVKAQAQVIDDQIPDVPTQPAPTV